MYSVNRLYAEKAQREPTKNALLKEIFWNCPVLNCKKNKRKKPDMLCKNSPPSPARRLVLLSGWTRITLATILADLDTRGSSTFPSHSSP